MTIYLIHFDKPYKHARHYLGSTNDLDKRLARHRNGNGARLMEVVKDAGIGWQCVRTWDGGHDEEKRLKRHKNTPRLCPVCNPDGWEQRAPQKEQQCK